jgi:hypothetical protein
MGFVTGSIFNALNVLILACPSILDCPHKMNTLRGRSAIETWAKQRNKKKTVKVGIVTIFIGNKVYFKI